MMSKLLNVTIVLLFIIVALVTPYVSAKGTDLSLAQNPEEQTSQGANFEEEIHYNTSCSFYIISFELMVTYPQVIKLKPQQVLYDVLKPPSRSIS